MAEKEGSIVTVYQGISDKLAASLSSADAHRLARTCVDRYLAGYAFERLGILPVNGLPGPSDPRIPAIMPKIGPDIAMEIDGLLKNREIVTTTLELLDSSSSRMSGSKARDAGVHYTPWPVADFICRRAIGSFIARQAGQAMPEARFDTMSLEQLHHAYFHILTRIRILDSSCGSGIFLEAALAALYGLRMRAVGTFKTRFSVEKGPLADDFMRLVGDDRLEYHLKKEIIGDNLFGVDIEPYSIEIAAVRLKLLLAKCVPGKVDLNGLRVNLSCENALLAPPVTLGGELFGGFDVIVGNPPYMRVKSMFAGDPKSTRLKKELASAVHSSGLYHHQEGNLNLYKLFIERNLALLKRGGSLGLIFPATFLNEATSEKLRAHLFTECEVEELVEIPERAKLFDHVNQATVILLLHKSRPRDGGFSLKLGASMQAISGTGEALRIGYRELASLTQGKMEVPLLSDPGLEWDMIRRLKLIPPFKGDAVTPPIGTITVGHVDETIDKEFISEKPTGDILVKGVHLKEYDVDLSPGGLQPRWVRKNDFLKKRPSALSVISQPRIIGRNTLNKACSRRLKFALLPPGYVCSNSVKQIVMTDPRIDPLYLLALLNSSTLNWYFELFNDQNNIRNYSVEALPIVRAPVHIQKIFIDIVRLLLSANAEVRNYLDKKVIDPMVYELYFSEGGYELINTISRLINDVSLIEMLQKDSDLNKFVNTIERSDQYRLIKNATYKNHKIDK